MTTFPIFKNVIDAEKPDVTYADVGGMKDQIEKLREVVEIPLISVGGSWSFLTIRKKLVKYRYYRYMYNISDCADRVVRQMIELIYYPKSPIKVIQSDGVDGFGQIQPCFIPHLYI